MNENIFIALVKDIISATTQPLLFAIAFSYMTMYFYLFSFKKCETGNGLRYALSIWLRSFIQDRKFRILFLYIFYITVVIFRTVLNREGWEDPLDSVTAGLWIVMTHPYVEGPIFNIQAIENIIMFVPFSFIGLLLMQYKRKNSQKVLFTICGSFLFSLLIETVQAIFKLGTFQLADLLFNTIGGLLGGVIFWVGSRLKIFML